ncbi:MAG: hypothetical protein HQL69_23520, partial [Magnetococcales bacterium]|nr:hypothetical protein [Magnetococcales bacterium]
MCFRLLKFRQFSVFITLFSILFAGCATTSEESRLRSEGTRLLSECKSNEAAVIPINNSQGQITGAKVCVRVDANDEGTAKQAAKDKIFAIVSDMIENSKKDQQNPPSYAQSNVLELERLKMPIRSSTLLAGQKDYSYYSEVKIINTHLPENGDYRLVEDLTTSDLRNKNVNQLKELLDQFSGMKLEIARFQDMQNEKVQLIKDELVDKGCDQKATIFYKKNQSRNMALNLKKLLERELTCANSIVDVRKKAVASKGNFIYFRSSQNAVNFSIPGYAAKFIE